MSSVGLIEITSRRGRRRKQIGTCYSHSQKGGLDRETVHGMADNRYCCRPCREEKEERPAPKDGRCKDRTEEPRDSPTVASRREGVNRVHERGLHRARSDKRMKAKRL